MAGKSHHSLLSLYSRGTVSLKSQIPQPHLSLPFESVCEQPRDQRLAVRRSAQVMTMAATYMETHWYFLGFVFYFISCFVVVQRATVSQNSVHVNSKTAVSHG